VKCATAGYVLVGGRSSRFGADKALALWQGRPLALRVAEEVRAAAGSATLVGSPEKYGSLGLAVIPDPVAETGPLAGLWAALEHTSAEWNLVVACDMPQLRRDFLAYVLKTAEDSVDLILPLDRQGRPEPLCAVYSRRCRPAIAEAVRGGVRKMTDAFAALRVRQLPFADYARFDPQGTLFTNWNTQAEMASAFDHG